MGSPLRHLRRGSPCSSRQRHESGGADRNRVGRERQCQTDLDYTDDDGTPRKRSRPFATARVHTWRSLAVEQKIKGIDSGNGEPLTLVDAALVAKLSASTTQTFEIDFAASLPDGRELVVIAPAHGTGYDQFRAFLGPSNALAQRTVTNFGSSLSGQRFATVMVDGAPADLTYLAGRAKRDQPRWRTIHAHHVRNDLPAH